MLRFRFSSGLILGLLLGVPGGALLGLLALPQHIDQAPATSARIQELTRRLETAEEDKRRMDRQLEQFQQLTVQMTASFNSLEQRFRALEEEEQLRGSHTVVLRSVPSSCNAARWPHLLLLRRPLRPKKQRRERLPSRPLHPLNSSRNKLPAARAARSHVEPKVDDVAVLDDVLLAFEAELAGLAALGVAAVADEIVVVRRPRRG